MEGVIGYIALNFTPMIRNILAVVVGLIVAGGTVFLVEMIGHVISPSPVDVGLSDELEVTPTPEPTSALVMVMVAHMIGTFAGAFVAALIGQSWRLGLAMIIGFMMMLGGTWNLYRFPHPVWMWVEVPLYLLAAWGGGKLGMVGRRTTTVR